MVTNHLRNRYFGLIRRIKKKRHLGKNLQKVFSLNINRGEFETNIDEIEVAEDLTNHEDEHQQLQQLKESLRAAEEKLQTAEGKLAKSEQVFKKSSKIYRSARNAR